MIGTLDPPRARPMSRSSSRVGRARLGSLAGGPGLLGLALTLLSVSTVASASIPSVTILPPFPGVTVHGFHHNVVAGCTASAVARPLSAPRFNNTTGALRLASEASTGCGSTGTSTANATTGVRLFGPSLTIARNGSYLAKATWALSVSFTFRIACASPCSSRQFGQDSYLVEIQGFLVDLGNRTPMGLFVSGHPPYTNGTTTGGPINATFTYSRFLVTESATLALLGHHSYAFEFVVLERAMTKVVGPHVTALADVFVGGPHHPAVLSSLSVS